MNAWFVAMLACLVCSFVASLIRHSLPVRSFSRGFAFGIEVGYFVAVPLFAWLWVRS